jgi:hypothetical protein
MNRGNAFYLGKTGIFPDSELVLTESMPCDELLVFCVPHDGGHLAARVNTLQLVHASRVPHPDTNQVSILNFEFLVTVIENNTTVTILLCAASKSQDYIKPFAVG